MGDYTYDHGSATSVTGTYGTLTIGSDGSYQYVADQDAADALDSGDELVNDVFTYTITDGTNIRVMILHIVEQMYLHSHTYNQSFRVNDPTTAQMMRE